MQHTVPNFELYGELLFGNHVDPVHHETIRERSSRHDWTIRPHRHSNLAQVFLFRTARVSVQLDAIDHLSSDALLLFVPPGVPHGFRFDTDVVGDVLSLKVRDLDPRSAALLDRPEMRRGCLLPRGRAAHFDAVAMLFDQLAEVYHGMDGARLELLQGLVQLILTYVGSDVRAQSPVLGVSPRHAPTRHEMQAERFCTLVETGYAQDVSVAEYAAQIGVSAPHLTRVCKAVLGAPPNELVRQRRLLEARRLLEYTRLSVAEIAHRSGFRDPAFFSRAFRKACGVSPAAYRKTSEV